MLSILIAYIGYSLLNIAQATQKIGLVVAKERKMKGLLIWITGTVGTSISIFVVLYAVSLGNVSLVGAMAGSGLASLYLFSSLVMKEKGSKRELLGVFIILGGAALIGAFSKVSTPSRVLLDALFILLAFVCGAYILSWITLHKKGKVMGILIGGFSGSLGGFTALFQKVSTTEFGRKSSLIYGSALNPLLSQYGFLKKVMEVLLNPYALLWVTLSIASMLVIQFAYRRDKAIRIIPAFSTNSIVIPVLGGVISLQEVLHPLQWFGVGLILTGMLTMTLRFEKRSFSK